MGDLDVDTAVDGGDGRFTGVLSPDWEIWGPMGGYLAGVALRAAGMTSGRARPASVSAHFLGGLDFGVVEIDCQVVRATRVATSVEVTVRQGDRVGLQALVWGVDEIDGLDHQTSRRPSPQPAPDETPTFEERLGRVENQMVHPFWQNLDSRPLRWIGDWEQHEPDEPMNEGWYRFVPTATFADPWADAVRTLIVLDLDSWPAAHRAHPVDVAWFAPTIELAARFVGDTAGEPWLRGIGESPIAANGLVAHRAEVWTPDGRLVANGGSTLLSRPVERRPDR